MQSLEVQITAQQYNQANRWQRIAAFTALAGTMLLAACTGGKPAEQTSPSDQAHQPAPTLSELDTAHGQELLATGSWNMIGATLTDGKLNLHRTEAAVLMLEEGGRPPENPEYQPNPPVNLFGTRLEMKHDGDVGIAAHLNDISGPATVSLLGYPNVRFDERIYRQEGVDITVDGQTVSINVYDGKSHDPVATEQIALDSPALAADIAFAQAGEAMHIMVNGKQVTIPAKVLNNQLWFGFDANATLSTLDAYPVNGNEVTAVDMSQAYASLKPSSKGLASIAKAHGHNKFVGTAVDLPMLMANPQYAEFVVNNFNLIATENLAKPQALQPQEGQFEFAELDALVKFAETHGMEVHGHALAFTEAYPQWLADKLSDPNTTRAQALQLLRNHIITVVTRYDGKHGHGQINAWDVVNEPFDPDNWGALNKQSIWYKKLGSSYILEAFKAAQEANPNAMLYPNDWGGETDIDRFKAKTKLAVSLKQQGIKNIGLGFQAHFDEKTLRDGDAMRLLYRGDLGNKFAQLNRLDIAVRISEASVAENNDPETQSDVYEMLAAACMQAPNCKDINLWGATNSSGGANDVGRYFYFTGGSYGNGHGDPGNDAPTEQKPNGEIVERPAMDGLRAGLSV